MYLVYYTFPKENDSQFTKYYLTCADPVQGWPNISSPKIIRYTNFDSAQAAMFKVSVLLSNTAIAVGVVSPNPPLMIGQVLKCST